MNDWDDLMDEDDGQEEFEWERIARKEKERAKQVIEWCAQLKERFGDPEDAYDSCIDLYRQRGEVPTREDLSRLGLEPRKPHHSGRLREDEG